MARSLYSDLDVNQMLLDRQTMTLSEVAHKHGVAISTVHKYTTRDAGGPPEPPPDFHASKVPARPTSTVLAKDYDFNEFYWQYCDFLGWTKDQPAKPVQASSGPELSVIMSDPHVPYHHEAALQWMLRRTSQQAKRLIIGGDLADMFYFSRYMKFEQHFSPVEELMRVQATLVALSQAYEEVVLMGGNHDARFLKYLKRTGMPVEVTQVFEYLYGKYAMHPIYVLAHKLPNVKVVEPLNKDFARFSYLYQHNDAVISHAEKYSQIANKTAEDVIKSLLSYHVPEGIIRPFRVLIQCHTHQAGKTWNDFGKIGIENGCMSMTPDYTGGAKTLPRRAPVLGFTELWQTKGVTDIEKTNFVPYQG